MREWEPWQDKEYAESRLKIWRNPTDPPEKWNKYKYERRARAGYEYAEPFEVVQWFK